MPDDSAEPSAEAMGFVERNAHVFVIEREKHEIAHGIDVLVAQAVQRERERHQWQPIETAPRNGMIIDVWLGDADSVDLEFYCSPGSQRSTNWCWFDGKFRQAMGLKMPTFVEPTHWMPLPGPP